MRTLAIVFLGLASAFAALSAAGTTCVAWNAQAYGPFAVLAPLEWIFQSLVFANFAAAALGFFVTYALLKGKRWSYNSSLVILAGFVVTALVQMYYSSVQRQVSFFDTAPTNMRLYATLLVTLYFAIIRIPPIWNKVDLFPVSASTSSFRAPVGIMLLASGVLCGTVFFWAGPSHMIGNSSDLVFVAEIPILLVTTLLVLLGSIALAPIRLASLVQLVPPSLQRSLFLNQASRTFAESSEPS